MIWGVSIISKTRANSVKLMSFLESAPQKYPKMAQKFLATTKNFFFVDQCNNLQKGDLVHFNVQIMKGVLISVISKGSMCLILVQKCVLHILQEML